jgi:dTDP-4-dehydrorhamnose 3,5-epimerase
MLRAGVITESKATIRHHLAPVESLPTRLEGPILIQPKIFRDMRGFFHESYRRDAFSELGIPEEYVQDNHSRSGKGIVRGMHFQPGMAKLVRCSRGEVVDVLVDIRRGSPTFGEWEAFTLNDENLHHLYAPDGFAHGFCVTSDVADVVYKCTAYYDPEAESGIAYNDPDVGIEWPDVELVPSDRDANAPLLKDVEAELPFVYEP